MATDHLGKLNAYHAKETCIAADVVGPNQMWERNNFQNFTKVFLQRYDVKWLLVRKVFLDVWQVIQTIGNALRQDKHFEPLTSQYQIFEWSNVHLEQDDNADKTRYINLLLRSSPRKLCLAKLERDMANLEELLHMLYQDLVVEVMQQIRDCAATHTIRSELVKEHESNIKQLKLITQLTNNFKAYERSQLKEVDNALNEALEHYANCSTVCQPIYRRYRLKHIHVNDEFTQMSCNHVEEKLLDEIKSLNAKIDRDRMASNCAVSYYFGAIEVCKEKISYWSEKYDDDYEAVCNKTYKRAQKLQRLRENWNECIARKATFRPLIDKVKKQAAEAADAAKAAAATVYEEKYLQEQATKPTKRTSKGKKQTKRKYKSVGKLK